MEPKPITPKYEKPDWRPPKPPPIWKDRVYAIDDRGGSGPVEPPSADYFYVAGQYSTTGRLYKFNADTGEIEWEYNCGATPFSMDCDGLGRVAIGTDNDLKRITPAGSVVWSNTSYFRYHDLVLTDKGRIYAAVLFDDDDLDFGLLKLSFQDGSELWSRTLIPNSEGYHGGVGCTSDGRFIVIGCPDDDTGGQLWLYNSSGDQIWHKDSIPVNDVTFDMNDRIWVATSHYGDWKGLHCYDRQGNSLGEYDLGETARRVAAGGQSKLAVSIHRKFIGEEYRNLYYLNQSGTIVWTLDLAGSWYLNGLCIDDADNVYVAGRRGTTSHKTIWKLSPAGAVLWDYDTTYEMWGVAIY